MLTAPSLRVRWRVVGAMKTRLRSADLPLHIRRKPADDRPAHPAEYASSCILRIRRATQNDSPSDPATARRNSPWSGGVLSVLARWSYRRQPPPHATAASLP